MALLLNCSISQKSVFLSWNIDIFQKMDKKHTWSFIFFETLKYVLYNKNNAIKPNIGSNFGVIVTLILKYCHMCPEY